VLIPGAPCSTRSLCYTPRVPAGSVSASNPAILIREAVPADIPEILLQRRGMYEDIGHKDPATLSAIHSLSAEYLSKALPEQSFRAWLAFAGDRAAGGGAIVISPWPAHPYDLECRRATILNVYTYPQYRRQGIGRQIMQTMIDWCKREGFVRVNLHASADGRHLYESMGFEASNEMQLKLR
jgi:GNAT superfamily N-acetyltransferase